MLTSLEYLFPAGVGKLIVISSPSSRTITCTQRYVSACGLQIIEVTRTSDCEKEATLLFAIFNASVSVMFSVPECDSVYEPKSA